MAIGNAIAVTVGLRFLVVPILRRLTGQPPETYHCATLTQAFQKRQGLRFFGKAHAFVDKAGQLQVEILPGQESFRIAPLMRANCWAIIDEQVASVSPRCG